jgi:hypothetical protein
MAGLPLVTHPEVYTALLSVRAANRLVLTSVQNIMDIPILDLDHLDFDTTAGCLEPQLYLPMVLLHQ